MIGTILDNRYELIENIGSGGTAVVYKAKCRILNRYVAVKILRPEYKNDQEFLKRFNIEAQAAGSLSHNNIVSVFDVGKQGDLNYIVMEYIDGITLKDYMSKKENLSINEAIDFSIQIASALEHAHSKNIIHRDIKPQNIILTNEGVLKVADFGLARATSEATFQKGSIGAMGSVHYMAPEQAKGGFTDRRSDIYSLGIVMFEMFTSRLPFDGDTPVSVAMKHLQDDFPKPSFFNENIPDNIEKVILKATEKDPDKRYNSAQELIADIKGEDVRPPVEDDNGLGKFTTKRLPLIPGDNDKEEEVPAPVDNKKKNTVTLVAAIGSAIVVIGVLCAIFINTFFLGGVRPGSMAAPDIVGKKFDWAVEEYKDKFVIVEEQRIYDADYDEGVIVSQSPERGDALGEDKTISVVVSLGSSSYKLEDYTDTDYRNVETDIKRINSKQKINIILKIEEEYSDDVEIGKVIRQTPTGGEILKTGDFLIIYVSKGKNSVEVTMPSIVGKTESEADAALAANNLKTGKVTVIDSSKPSGTVVSQAVAAGTVVSSDTAINYSISKNDAGVAMQHNIALRLPTNKETIVVEIKLGGATLYRGTHNTNQPSVNIPITVESNQTVDIYYDGIFNKSLTIG